MNRRSDNLIRAYTLWSNMHRRCNNPDHPAYADYGGRGITVCPEWDSFEQFLVDMGEPPAGLTFERRDNSKGYYKANCHWATWAEQARNRRSTRNYTINGVTKCLADWAKEHHMNASTVWCRLARGRSIEEALTSFLYQGKKS